MSEQPVGVATDHRPKGWRAGAVRVIANAVLVLVAYEVVSLMLVAAQIVVSGAPPPMSPSEMVLFAVAYFFVRWVVVLPVLLPVLVGIEFVARRAPYARVLTTLVAFAPMVLWELTNSPGAFPSPRGAILGVTAVLFGVLARLPARVTDRDAARPPAGPLVAPR